MRVTGVAETLLPGARGEGARPRAAEDGLEVPKQLQEELRHTL